MRHNLNLSCLSIIKIVKIKNTYWREKNECKTPVQHSLGHGKSFNKYFCSLPLSDQGLTTNSFALTAGFKKGSALEYFKMVSFLLPVSGKSTVSAPESLLRQALSMVSCLSSLGGRGLPISCLLLQIQGELLVFLSVLFSLVLIEWQLPSSYMWNQKPEVHSSRFSHYKSHQEEFSPNLCQRNLVRPQGLHQDIMFSKPS